MMTSAWRQRGATYGIGDDRSPKFAALAWPAFTYSVAFTRAQRLACAALKAVEFLRVLPDLFITLFRSMRLPCSKQVL
jgi:hypothetical protein